MLSVCDSRLISQSDIPLLNTIFDCNKTLCHICYFNQFEGWIIFCLITPVFGVLFLLTQFDRINFVEIK